MQILVFVYMRDWFHRNYFRMEKWRMELFELLHLLAKVVGIFARVAFDLYLSSSHYHVNLKTRTHTHAHAHQNQFQLQFINAVVVLVGWCYVCVSD